MILAFVIAGFAVALIAPLIYRLHRRWSGGILCLLPLALTLGFAGYIPSIASGGVVIENHEWVSTLGIRFSFYLDGLSLVFALLICGIGTMIVLYSGGYLAGHAELGRFYLYIIGFMASMLGVVVAGNLISLFIFWELTSITSYFLIGFDHQREKARSAALQALLVTGLGGLALLAGLLMMGIAGGSFELPELLNQGDSLRRMPLHLPMLLLLLIGVFTKSAQFPFHFWLPSAMEGPAPVSAFLHSATMVKAGVYLALRLSPVFTGSTAWHQALILFGAVTMIGGAWLAVIQTDMKRLLAYTTVNGLGMLIFLTGLGTPTAAKAAVVYLIAHALYKGSLFLSAGVVDHETGSRNVRELRGLWRRLPLITTATVLAGLSMAGLPPLVGFIGKELIYEATLNAASPVGVTAAALAASALLMAASAVLLVRPFFGRPDPDPSHSDGHGNGHGVGFDLWLGPSLLAAAGLVFGLLPGLVSETLVAPAAAAVVKGVDHAHLALWHGLSPMLALSLATIALGIGAYALYVRNENRIDRWRWIGAVGPDRWYDICLDGLKGLARWQTRILQGGFLHHYIMAIVVAAVALTTATMIGQQGWVLSLPSQQVRIFEVVIVLLMILAATVTLLAKSRLSAIVAMGVIGYGIALLFVDFGAPDLAMTQFIIETMTVILFVLVIYRLPRYEIISSVRQRFFNAVVAIASGALMTTLVLVALSVKQGSQLSHFFAANSLQLAHGRNVVNVIIVDFRALDTLGEIAVLALAGIGVYTLLKLRPHSDQIEAPAPEKSEFEKKGTSP